MHVASLWFCLKDSGSLMPLTLGMVVRNKVMRLLERSKILNGYGCIVV